jgi:hypothetical protein
LHCQRWGRFYLKLPMTDKQDPITHAARLLREAAEELRQAHAYNNSEGWENETDAKAAYDEHMAAAQALEDWEAAVGAGGVQALSAAPAVLHEPTNEMYRAAQKIALPYDDDGGTIILNTSQIRAIWHAMLAASPTPPAEQQAMESVLVDGAASQPPISNTLWRMLTGGYEHTYILQLPNDSRDRRELIDRACHNWRRICAEIGNSAVASAVSPQTAQAPQQAAPKAAPARRVGTIAHIGNGSTTLTSAIAPVLAAPQQEAQEPGEIPESIERMATGRYKVVPSHESMFHRWAVVAGSGTQQLYLGSEVECQNMARKFAGAFLDGAFVAMQRTAPQPAPAPLSDDTERLNWLLWKLPGDALRYVVGELSDTSSGAEFRAAIDAALAAQGSKA